MAERATDGAASVADEAGVRRVGVSTSQTRAVPAGSSVAIRVPPTTHVAAPGC